MTGGQRLSGGRLPERGPTGFVCADHYVESQGVRAQWADSVGRRSRLVDAAEMETSSGAQGEDRHALGSGGILRSPSALLGPRTREQEGEPRHVPRRWGRKPHDGFRCMRVGVRKRDRRRPAGDDDVRAPGPAGTKFAGSCPAAHVAADGDAPPTGRVGCEHDLAAGRLDRCVNVILVCPDAPQARERARGRAKSKPERVGRHRWRAEVRPLRRYCPTTVPPDRSASADAASGSCASGGATPHPRAATSGATTGRSRAASTPRPARGRGARSPLSLLPFRW